MYLTPVIPQINAATGLSLTEEVYKDDGAETGSISGDYETLWGPGGAGAEYSTISLSVGGTPTTLSPLYAFAKDGNNDPYWYLWDLTALGWDGQMDLDFGDANNFLWPDQGSISHVSLFSGPGGDVPEPSIIALFGLGLIGLGFARRKVRS